MKVCIIGNGLVSLTLANALIKKNLDVHIISGKKFSHYDKSRTLGISKSNVDYFNNKIVSLQKIPWEIKNIKIFSENLSNKKILDFKNDNKQIFSIIKNYRLQKLLYTNLKKNKFIRFKNLQTLNKLDKKEYNLIINCDSENEITKKFFSKKIEKNYDSYAFTTTITHKKKINNTAYQNFTKEGPIAFLPISNNQTSVVYSIRNKKIGKNINLNDLIKKFNPSYEIIKIADYSCFELKSSNVRNYYKDNILAFGDLLHKIHPLAGQGFNMSLRDIKFLSNLIDKKINLGLDVDKSVCIEFQKKLKDKNYLFSVGIDWIYEIFNFESKINTNILSKSINIIGKNRTLNSLFKKFADNGLTV